MSSKVVHCKREPYDVYIGRPSKWGNPFEIGRDGTREEVIALYRNYVLTTSLFLDLPELKDKVLGCWCSPKPCHGDVLIELLELYYGRGKQMSNLYQKYRPQSFDEMIGSESQIAALKKILAKSTKAHAYLFTGDPGCGKTTAARIAARELGGEGMSIRELNSADNRGIETARDIIERTRYMPADGEATVFIIDEVHMATKEWQNAMLKTLEDTPEHVYFFLCTTNPEKLIPAIKSRCTELKFNAMKPDEILLLLRNVNNGEKFGLSKQMLIDIGATSKGSPRNAIVMLEKIASLEDPEEQAKLLAIGTADPQEAEMIDLCRALMRKDPDWAEVMEIASRFEKEDLEGVRRGVTAYMRSILKKNLNIKAAIIFECFADNTYFDEPENRFMLSLLHVFNPG